MHYWTNDPVYLNRTVEIADMLIDAFETDNGIPYDSYDFSKKEAYSGDFHASTAEVTTLQLEWRYLAYLTKNPKYWDVVERAMEVVMKPSDKKINGLVPIYITYLDGQFYGDNYRLGSRGDSYYGRLLS
jgi:hypothetical protein